MVFSNDQFWGHRYLMQTYVTFLLPRAIMTQLTTQMINTPYISGRNIEKVVASLEEVSEVIFQWFRDNQFQGNANKCHVLLSTDKQVQVNIGTAQIENTQNEKLLGIIIDSKLNFDKHIQQICSRASAKLKALARIAPFMNITKRKILMNAFFNAQFSYCPLTWMFHSRKLNNKNNKLYE